VREQESAPPEIRWPDWTKRALARLLAMLFSTTRIEEWEKCLFSDAPYKELSTIIEDGRVMGHFVKVARCWTEQIKPLDQSDFVGKQGQTVDKSVEDTLKFIEEHSSRELKGGSTESTMAFFTNFSGVLLTFF